MLVKARDKLLLIGATPQGMHLLGRPDRHAAHA
jgi:hypothetical protein